MKVRFNLESGANADSNHDSGWLDVVEDLNYTVEDWKMLHEDEKHQECVEYFSGNGYPEFYVEEKD